MNLRFSDDSSILARRRGLLGQRSACVLLCVCRAGGVGQPAAALQRLAGLLVCYIPLARSRINFVFSFWLCSSASHIAGRSTLHGSHRNPFRIGRLAYVPCKFCKLWLRDETKGLALEENKPMLSRIFLWYAGDFETRGGSPAYAAQYAPAGAARDALATTAPDYFAYDWNLNTQ